MEQLKYTTRELTKEEGEALTKEMTAVLEKHGAEMGVISQISILKRVEVKEEGIKSPFIQNGDTNNETPKAD